MWRTLHASFTFVDGCGGVYANAVEVIVGGSLQQDCGTGVDLH